MKNLLFTIILVSQYSIFAQIQWQWQNPLPQGNYLTDICFVDSMNGYSCGYLGTILKTTNGGKDWKNIETNINDLFMKLSFPDLRNGWALGYDKSSLYRTTDAGMNWNKLNHITNSSMYDFEMVNDSVGYSCGPDSKIFKTIDGGLTWNQSETPFYISSLNSIDFINNDIGYCVGNTPYLLKTTNGGQSWQDIFSPISYINFVQFKTKNFGYIAGYSDNQGIVLITTNGGNSWTGGISGNSINQAFFENLNEGWIKDGYGNVLYTIDGGKNWAKLFNNCIEFFFINKNYSWSTVNLNNIFFSNTGWKNYFSQTSSVSHQLLEDIAIQDSNNIFICGTKEILRTGNGGRSWSILYTDSTKEFSTLKIKNKKEIWAVGSGGTITYSLDNGNSWQEHKLPASWLGDICFIDSLKGFAVGTKYFNGKIFRTSDGGKSWDTLTNIPDADDFDKIQFSNDSLGWMSSNNGIYQSEDGGKSWNLLKAGFYLSLETYNHSIWTSAVNQIVFSTDFGSTWNNIQVYEIIGGDIRSIVAIDFINENIGWVSVDNGRIFKTTDGGFTWNEEKRLAGIGLYGIKFIDENKGWAVGNGGSILNFGNLITSTKDNKLKVYPYSFKLFQNYPNPFNPTTTIKFTLNKKAIVRIEIFDLLGREIKNIINTEITAGEHEFLFDGNNLPSGIYFCKIAVEEKKQIIKMVLLK